MTPDKLTGRNFWETYWETDSGKKKNNRPNMSLLELLKTFDTWLPAVKELKILEIGGAKGELWIYQRVNFGIRRGHW